MSTPIFYQTLNNVGIDPTTYYTNLATAGGSVTPEYPAPPFITGTRAFGSDGSEFVFVQASTSISLTDFVVINAGSAYANNYMVNSINTTNVWSSLFVGIGSTGLILKQSVSFIPAGAFFWCLTKGQFVPATNCANIGGANVLGTGGVAAGVGLPALYVALTGVGVGILTSVSTTLSPGIAGINVISSLTTGIGASICPPVGTLSSIWLSTTTTGLTMGPIVGLNNPRLVTVFGVSVAPTAPVLLSGPGNY